MRIFPTVDFSIRSSVVLRSWRNREVSGNTLTPILLAIYIFLPIPGLYVVEEFAYLHFADAAGALDLFDRFYVLLR